MLHPTVQLAAALNCSFLIHTLSIVLPFLKCILQFGYLTCQVICLFTQLTFISVAEFCNNFSTIETFLTLFSIIVTIKLLLDAADLEISISWRD